MEVWKDIPNFEGIYEASTFGNIRTKEGKTTSNSRYKKRVWKSRLLKGRGDNPKTGKRVSLWKEGKQQDFLVARLIALTFLGEPPEGFTVNHKDGNRFNNRVENLEWLSLGDNIRHGFASGLYHTQIAVAVANSGQILYFQSLSELDRFLGRCNGYSSGRIRKNKPIMDVSGNVYVYSAGKNERRQHERNLATDRRK